MLGWISFAAYLAGSAASPQVAIAVSHQRSAAVLYVGAASATHRVDGTGFAALSIPCDAGGARPRSLGFATGSHAARLVLNERVRDIPSAADRLLVYADSTGAAMFEGASCENVDAFLGATVAVVTRGLEPGTARRLAAEVAAVPSQPAERLVKFVRETNDWWPDVEERRARLVHRGSDHSPLDLEVRGGRSVYRALSWRYLGYLSGPELVFQLRADDRGDPDALDRAEAAARRALEVWPKYGRLRARLALILSARAAGDSAAIRQAELAIHYAPSDANVRRLAAEVYWRAGATKEAKRQIVAAALINPGARPVEDFGDLLNVLERSVR